MLSSPSASSLTAVLNGNVFLHGPATEYPCPTAEYPCSAQPQSILSAQPQSIPTVLSCRVLLQCPTAEYPQCPTAKYPCSARLQSIPAVPNRRVSSVPNRKVSLQCSAAEYCCSAQPQSIPAVPNHQVFLPPSIPAVPNRRVSPIFPETLHLLSNNGFRVGMLEVTNFQKGPNLPLVQFFSAFVTGFSWDLMFCAEAFLGLHHSVMYLGEL